MKLKAALRQFVPPIALDLAAATRRAVARSPEGLTFAPQGWNSLPSAAPASGKRAASFPGERERWQPFVDRLKSGQAPVVSPDCAAADLGRAVRDHNAYMIFAYVLARCGRGASELRILDYGASVGYYYWVARALFPEARLAYHCKELPEVARQGRLLVPEVVWHTDDSCLAQRFDLVMFSSSLQYVQHWQELLARAAGAVDRFLFLTQVPTVERVPSYVALQRLEGRAALCWQVNKTELLDAVRTANFCLDREFLVDVHERVHGAPEQPTYRGFLFERAREPA